MPRAIGLRGENVAGILRIGPQVMKLVVGFRRITRAGHREFSVVVVKDLEPVFCDVIDDMGYRGVSVMTLDSST